MFFVDKGVDWDGVCWEVVVVVIVEISDEELYEIFVVMIVLLKDVYMLI